MKPEDCVRVCLLCYRRARCSTGASTDNRPQIVICYADSKLASPFVWTGGRVRVLRDVARLSFVFLVYSPLAALVIPVLAGELFFIFRGCPFYLRNAVSSKTPHCMIAAPSRRDPTVLQHPTPHTPVVVFATLQQHAMFCLHFVYQ